MLITVDISTMSPSEEAMLPQAVTELFAYYQQKAQPLLIQIVVQNKFYGSMNIRADGLIKRRGKV